MQNSIDRILELLGDRGDAGNGGSWVNIIQNVDFFINYYSIILILYYIVLNI